MFMHDSLELNTKLHVWIKFKNIPTFSFHLSPDHLPSPLFLRVKPCCTTAPQSGSWATCSRISSTSRFFPGGSTSFVIFCCRVRGSAISWINWPSGLLSTYRNTSRENADKYYLSLILLIFPLIFLNDDLKCITLYLIIIIMFCAQKVTVKTVSWSSNLHTLVYFYTTTTQFCYVKHILFITSSFPCWGL